MVPPTWQVYVIKDIIVSSDVGIWLLNVCMLKRGVIIKYILLL